MSDALITGLAALTGSLIGGLTTVLATHLQNRSAAQRERERRDREAAYAKYEAMKNLLSDFLAEWVLTIEAKSQLSASTPEHRKRVHVLRLRIQLLAPEMTSSTDNLQDMLVGVKSNEIYPALVAYQDAARKLLSGMEPEKGSKFWEKS